MSAEYIEQYIGARGAVLHQSAQTVLCFRIQFFLLVLCCVLLFGSQNISSEERQPAYSVEWARVPQQSLLVSIFYPHCINQSPSWIHCKNIRVRPATVSQSQFRCSKNYFYHFPLSLVSG